MDNASSSTNVEEEIYRCLNLDSPQSFFLFAGAGSGKTRSLVEVMKRFRIENIARLKLNAQKVAIITFTNAACDEIKSRLEFDSAFHVSTIHSFAWELIKNYTNDIKNWLRNSLESEIVDLKEQQRRSKNTNTKTYINRANKIELITKRIKSLESIKEFIYNPNGDNTSLNSLNHSEVIYITADFVQNKPLMQNIFIGKYPILLIDESQDTKKELIDAFFELQKEKSDRFTLGMFGDMMQRIYTDGKIGLDQNIPDTWAKPAKKVNYRCPKRVITLINKIRSATDGQVQTAIKDDDGIVRLFIVDARYPVDKADIEFKVVSRMAKVSNDSKWNDKQPDVKILTLEHHMAAERGGFSDFFAPLYSVDKLKSGLIDGTLPGLHLFTKIILPLINAKKSGDNFEIARITLKYSPLLKKEFLHNSLNCIKEIEKSNKAIEFLFTLWENGNCPALNDILKEIFESGIFQIPEVLIPIAMRLQNNSNTKFEESDDISEKDSTMNAWDEALKCSFLQFESYVRYISNESQFGTHQGIKGLEFPRVMVILDDDEARGFLFSYEKLFGAKKPSETDVNNMNEGKETSIERTRRLFYVTCSRAERSLAILAYTKDPQKVKNYVLAERWFDENEIIDLI